MRLTLLFCCLVTFSFAQSPENQAEAVRKKLAAKDFAGAKADLTKLTTAGMPARFQDLDAGVADYVKNYLSKPDPYL